MKGMRSNKAGIIRRFNFDFEKETGRDSPGFLASNSYSQKQI